MGNKIFKKLSLCIFILLITINISMVSSLGKSGQVIKVNDDVITKTNSKDILITIETCWEDDNIDEVLKILKDNNVKATFFIPGNYICKYKSRAKKINEAGHNIENITNTYIDLENLSKEEIVKEINDGDMNILSITGKVPELFRFPMNKYKEREAKIVRETNHHIISYSYDIKSIGDIKPDIFFSGSIINLHMDDPKISEELLKVINNSRKNKIKLLSHVN